MHDRAPPLRQHPGTTGRAGPRPPGHEHRAPTWASATSGLSGAMNMTSSLFGAAMAIAGRYFRVHRDEPVFIAFACSYARAALCWLLVDVTKPLVPPDQGVRDANRRPCPFAAILV